MIGAQSIAAMDWVHMHARDTSVPLVCVCVCVCVSGEGGVVLGKGSVTSNTTCRARHIVGVAVPDVWSRHYPNIAAVHLMLAGSSG